LKKLRFNKTFKSPISNIGDELYPNGFFIFNITKLLAFIHKNKAKLLPEEVNVRSVRSPFSKLNETTIKNADLSVPIILAEISPGQFNVIDGNHRIEKAYRTEVKTIKAYRLLAKQHVRFLHSIEAYKAYVQYWNEKVKTIEKDHAF
jgi:hypothetical protein